MAKYLVFAGHNYYPTGGWDDLIGSDDDLEMAKSLVANKYENYDWFQIVNTEISEIVYDYSRR